jgi:hypothetical protein
MGDSDAPQSYMEWLMLVRCSDRGAHNEENRAGKRLVAVFLKR